MLRTIIAHAAVLTLACAPGATLPPDALDPVRIGIVTSLSGGLGTDGPGWLDASRLAAHEINAAGGPLPGRPLELVVLDDQTDSATVERIVGELLMEGVVGVVGSAASSITLPLASMLLDEEMPQVSCCSTSDLITDFNVALVNPDDRFLFRTAAPDRLQARVVAIAASGLMCTSLAILHLDDAYGEPFGQAIEAAWLEGGGTVTVRVSFTENQPSYASEVARIRDAIPAADCIALVAFPRSAGTILRDWASASGSTTVTWIGTDGVRAPGFIDEVADLTLIRNFFGTSPITDAPTPEYNAFRDRFEAVFQSTPIPFSANQYDATALLALAIARAGSTDGVAIRDALREVSTRGETERDFESAGDLASALAEIRRGNDIDYQGASGNVDFDEYGNVVTPYEIWRYDAPSVTPCAQSTDLGDMRGSFCRFRTLSAEEIEP